MLTVENCRAGQLPSTMPTSWLAHHEKRMPWRSFVMPTYFMRTSGWPHSGHATLAESHSGRFQMRRRPTERRREGRWHERGRGL